MSVAELRSPPSLEDYIPLGEHQSQTPATFFGGKPVLHYHAAGAKAWIPKSQRGILPLFPADLSSEPTVPESATLNDSVDETVEQKVDLFVNSQTFSLFSPSAERGVSIPYPQISIHAIKTLRSGEQSYPAIYLQLDLADSEGSDEIETVELTLILPSADQSETTKLYEAISECSNLNPDPVEDGDDEEDDVDRIIFEGDHGEIEGLPGVFSGSRDGGLPPALPGSSGWITAENVHEYFDEDGNWIGGEEEEEGVSGELGDGAGAVHARDEDDEPVNGYGTAEEGETKKARVE